MRKKKWKTPQLAVLVRKGPEETTLVACKKNGGGGPDNQWSNCYNTVGTCNYECSIMSAS